MPSSLADPIIMVDVGVWYGYFKLIHTGLVLAGQGWAMDKPWRMLSYGIDTLLLTAGVALRAMLSMNPITNSWLGVKLLLQELYIGLGSLAHAHHPLGFLLPRITDGG